MEKVKEFKIKFIPTGNVFSLPEAEIDELVKIDRGNYEVLDKDYVFKKKGNVLSEPTVLEQVMDDTNTNENNDENSGDQNDQDVVRGLEDYTVDELKKFAEENNLKKSGSKAELLERCIEFTRQLAAKQEADGEIVAGDGGVFDNDGQPLNNDE